MYKRIRDNRRIRNNEVASLRNFSSGDEMKRKKSGARMAKSQIENILNILF
jgi:hypothetical protein